MHSLPPLRTVRAAGPTSANATTPAPAAGRAFDPALNVPGLPAAARDVIQDVLDLQLADAAAVRRFLAQLGPKAGHLFQRDRVGQALTQAGVLTAYQRDRVLAGSTFGLVLGNYRVLDRLNGGTVGVVFLGEHVFLRRRVAMKVLPVDDDVHPEVLERFHAEMRLLASLDHPHIVSAYDAGVLTSPVPGQPSLHYLVLELVTGGDLEQYVYANGPRPIAQACEWARQAASGLQAAHDRHLVHRDLKPSNLLLADGGRVKVVDFGLARQLASTITRPTMLLGSVEFMAPEQSLDPTAVGPAADVYGLGATLFWTLTGQLPFARGETVVDTVKALQTGRPRRLREFLPNAPRDLDVFLDRMLARDPARRPTALEVMEGIAPFAIPDDEPAGDAGDKDGGPAVPKTGSELIHLRQVVRQMGGSLRARDGDVRKAQDALLFAMAKMAESHDGETIGHLRRMQEYVRVLAAALAGHPGWLALQDSQYVADLVRCVPLHDVGKIGLPDTVLGKPGVLNFEERALVETHPQIGCDILEALAREHGDSLGFLSTARAVVRHHHERWDGTGYPDRLAGDRIPPAARLVAMADVYDSLRRDRPHRPALDHPAAVAAMTDGLFDGQFDPAVLDAFRACEKAFAEVYLTTPN